MPRRVARTVLGGIGGATRRSYPAEVFVKINGTTHYLWRAVDQHGNVLDILVQPRRDAKAAKRFFRKLLTKQCQVPRAPGNASAPPVQPNGSWRCSA